MCVFLNFRKICIYLFKIKEHTYRIYIVTFCMSLRSLNITTGANSINIWHVSDKLVNMKVYITMEDSSEHVLFTRGCRGRDRMVVGFTTINAISVCHHWCYGFDSRSRVQHYVIKFVGDLREVHGFHRVLRFPPSTELTASI